MGFGPASSSWPISNQGMSYRAPDSSFFAFYNNGLFLVTRRVVVAMDAGINAEEKFLRHFDGSSRSDLFQCFTQQLPIIAGLFLSPGSMAITVTAIAQHSDPDRRTIRGSLRIPQILNFDDA